MTSRRLFIPAAVAAAAALAPAASAQAPQPTLSFDSACYTAEQPLAFTGAGYTPSGPVTMMFSVPGQLRGSLDVQADPSGGISGRPGVQEDSLLADDEDRREIFVTANDTTRVDAGAQPPESQFGVAQLTFTRWAGFSPGRYVPGRTVEVEAYGWAFAAGKTLWFLFQKGRTTVASVKVGKLSATCGDRTGRIRVPRKLKAGSYRLVLSTQKRTPGDLYTWRKGRVVKAAAASSAAGASRAMARG